MKTSIFQCRRSSRHSIGNSFPVKLFLAYLIVSPFLCTLANAQSLYEEKKNNQNRPFYMGSRYGRSGQRSAVQVTPRTDQFFMGGRYGKRASMGFELGDILTNGIQNGDTQRASNEDGDVKSDASLFDDNSAYQTHHRLLRCAYLGVGNLYKCYNRDNINQMLSSL